MTLLTESARKLRFGMNSNITASEIVHKDAKIENVSLSKLTNPCVILQTANVESSSSDSFEVRNARALFDTGATRSFVTQKLASELNLKSVGQMSLNINTFGCSKSYM